MGWGGLQCTLGGWLRALPGLLVAIILLSACDLGGRLAWEPTSVSTVLDHVQYDHLHIKRIKRLFYCDSL